MTRDEWLEKYDILMRSQEELYRLHDAGELTLAQYDEEQADMNIDFAMMARYAHDIIANSEHISDPDRTTDLNGDPV